MPLARRRPWPRTVPGSSDHPPWWAITSMIELRRIVRNAINAADRRRRQAVFSSSPLAKSGSLLPGRSRRPPKPVFENRLTRSATFGLLVGMRMEVRIPITIKPGRSRGVTHEPKDFVRSEAKLFAILEAFDVRSPELTIAEMAGRSGLDLGAAFGLVHTLRVLG